MNFITLKNTRINLDNVCTYYVNINAIQFLTNTGTFTVNLDSKEECDQAMEELDRYTNSMEMDLTLPDKEAF